MNKREDALREALQKNEEEFQRWQMYLKENETAVENMTMFGKRLKVDVMVPIGKKALMPGYLIHTNELLVGHYQGYFSKCTIYKAKEICELRIQMAKEHLKKLETEADLWQNKLNKPYVEGVMPSGEEHEIIEEFNLETEKLWKENHRVRVRQAKLKEREEREAQQQENSEDGNTSKHKTDEEIFKMLEEAEVLEELEQELDKLELDEVNDETIRKLMSGEMQMPQEKKRLAHQNKTTEQSTQSSKIVKRNSLEKSTEINTNNNSQPNQEIMNIVNTLHEDVGELEEETLPEEVTLIKEQARFLDGKDQIGFYDYQIEIIRQKIQRLSLRTQQELDEKIRLLNILEHLEELLEEAEETVGAAELNERDTDEEVEYNGFVQNQERNINENGKNNDSNKKRRISFALEDQTLVFKKHEAVTEMLPSKVEKVQRDVIKLDNLENNQKENYKHKVENSLNKTDLIQDKVEKNLQFVAENQSKKDFDLVQQIIESSVGETKTLHIKFKHSEKEGCPTNCKESVIMPGNPADLYIKWKESLETVNEPSTLFINNYEGEDEVKVPMLKEVDRQTAYIDPKSKFSNPLQAKSILKNKSAVDKENHTQRDKNIKNKKSKKEEENECSSAYYKVMNDVVEKPLTEPEPLPEVKFIDAHAPKKRISRFKQMRQECEKT